MEGSVARYGRELQKEEEIVIEPAHEYVSDSETYQRHEVSTSVRKYKCHGTAHVIERLAGVKRTTNFIEMSCFFLCLFWPTGADIKRIYARMQ